MAMEALSTAQHDDWTRVLESCAPYDFYHLPAYHALAEAAGEGAARLFVFRAGNHTIAAPLLLRPLAGVAGAGAIGSDWLDATSVYGYAGPVATSTQIPPEIISAFQAALKDQLRALRVVSVFSRLHPIIPQRDLLKGLGETPSRHPTVSIDLTLPIEVQRAKYRKSHKERINKLRRLGLRVAHCEGGAHLDEFVELYHETMRRVGARPSYFFPRSYFEQLAASLGDQLQLFVGLHEGRVVCGSLFVATCGMLQYHLGGTLDAARHLAPMKLVIEEARLWANQRGLKILHLGGGTTAQPDDPLLYFKMGFSSLVHDFAVWRWVLFPDIHEKLCEAHALRNADGLLTAADADFFPPYRAPAMRSAFSQNEGAPSAAALAEGVAP